MAPYFRRLAVAAAAGAAVVALAGAGAASASVPTGSPKATPQCHTQILCVTPDLYNPNGEEQVLSATIGAQNAPVVLEEPDPSTVSQDWRGVAVGTVNDLTHNGDELRYGLSGADVSRYGGDYAFMLQYTPDGNNSGLCLANLNNTIARLRHCSVHRWQLFIVTNCLFGTFNTVIDGAYAMSFVPAQAPDGHLVLTGARDHGTTVHFAQSIGGIQSINQDWDVEAAALGKS